jgi:hypothetical protein
LGQKRQHKKRRRFSCNADEKASDQKVWNRASNAKERTLGQTLLVYVLRDLQNAELRFEHEFFLLAQWLLLVKQAYNLIKRLMRTAACFILLRGWHIHLHSYDWSLSC